MFQNLSDRLALTIKKLKGHGKLSESNIAESLREVRLALLEADVNYKVAKDFVEKVRARAVGGEVMNSLTPAQQVIKIVHQELTDLMGPEAEPLNMIGRLPLIYMLVGLQGSGKTTTSGKLALDFKRKGRKPFLVPADVHRPAAITQLKKLGAQIEVPVYDTDPAKNPVDICVASLLAAAEANADIIILDTAGRLHVDEPLMAELQAIKSRLQPTETLLVADSMTGQDAVNVASAFNERLGLSGVILTKVEGDARGGAALSIKAVAGVPVKLVGVGEKLDALDVFHPERMAGRILGMGDVLGLVEKAAFNLDKLKTEEMARKIAKDSFDLEDFAEQLQQIKKLGSLDSILKMIPGMGKLTGAVNLAAEESEIKRTEAIISSMTRQERQHPDIITSSRRKRIAKGSGTTVADVNRLLKNFQQARKMMKTFSRPGGKRALRGLLGNMGGL